MALENSHLNIVQYLVSWDTDFRSCDDYVVQYLVSLGTCHPHVIINYNLINGLNAFGNFEVIIKSVNKIIKARKWNSIMFRKLNFADIHIQFILL